jgi:type VI secretion system secreted protein VgrG
MAYTQAKRHIAISTPLGKDVLLLRGFHGSEAISQLFHFNLDLL